MPRVIEAGEAWFESEEMGEGLYRIRERFITQDCTCNIWLILGRDKAVMIDSGLGLMPLRPTVEKLTGKPVLAVASHSHFDHIGGHHEFDHCLGHASEAHIMASPTPENTLAWGFLDEKFFTAFPHEDFTIEGYSLKPAPLTGHLDEGDVIDLGDRTLQVLHLPGHAPSAVALYEAKTGQLFSGDVVYDGELLDELICSDKEDYVVSMERLRELPVDAVHPGHYGSFDQARLDEIARDYIAGRRAPGCPLPG